MIYGKFEEAGVDEGNDNATDGFGVDGADEAREADRPVGGRGAGVSEEGNQRP